MSLYNPGRGPIAFVSVGVLLASHGNAQQPPAAPAKPDASAMARVTVSGTADFDDRKESTVARSVVTQQDIVKFGDSTIEDVLRRVPGVTVGSAAGRSDEIRLRGLAGGYTQILLNGEPVAPGFSIGSISPVSIDRIEITRGATADMSAQAIAGTINIILKQRVAANGREVKAALSGYRGNPSGFLDGQVSGRRGALSYALTGGLSSAKNTFPSIIGQSGVDAEGVPVLQRVATKVESGRIDTANLAPRADWKLGADNLSADALLQYRKTRGSVLDSRASLLGAPALYAGNNLQIDMDTTIARSRLAWSRAGGDNARLDVKLGLGYNRRKVVNDFYGFDADGNTVLDEDTDSDAIDRSVSPSGKYRLPYLRDHAIVLGWDSELSQRSENRVQRQQAPAGYPARNLDEQYDARVTRLAVFAQDEWQIAPGWSAYLGLRWEGLLTRSQANVHADVSSRSSVVSPALQTVWQLPGSKSDQVRLGLSRTYKAPTTRDLMARRYVANDNTPTTPDFQGNPFLRPELAWGVDLAYEHYLGDAGLISISATARRIDDIILSRMALVNNVWVSTPENNGDASTRGVEMEGKLSLAKLNKAFPELDLRANIARNWSTVHAVPGPDNRLDKQTEISANVGADYRFRNLPLTLGGNFGWQSGGAVRLSATQSASYSPKRVLDVYGLWKVDARSQWRFTGSNLLHQDYAVGASYFDARQRLHQLSVSPSYAVLRVAFEMKI